ncbi:unnamed protein product [Schistocephalus solidus]|uniref:OCEL domain-containing protein n=1 Tax=Schistocephalus solidus TaxID=70667 RepID=A0A183SU51_SCHSO|nr:unnamed protein product [Schistocephalus solidus]
MRKSPSLHHPSLEHTVDILGLQRSNSRPPYMGHVKVKFFPVASSRATVTTSGLNQVRVPGVVCASTPGMSDSQTSNISPLKKSYGGSDSNPVGGPGDPRCRWLDRSPPRHFSDEAPTATPTKAPSNQITEKLEKLHAPDDNATVETRWCQLRNVIQSTALDVLGRAHRRHQDWFDDNDADISNLLAEKNRLHKAYMDLRTDATKAAFFRCRCLVRHRLREMQDDWMI